MDVFLIYILLSRFNSLARKLADNCTDLQGFLALSAVGGGQLSDDYGKKPKLGFTVYPSSHISTSVVEPYDCVLSTIDADVLPDNETIYAFCKHSAQPTQTSITWCLEYIISRAIMYQPNS